MTEDSTQSIPPKFRDHCLRQTIIETITMRDQFAMAALSSGKITGNNLSVARQAYEVADAMLEARKEKK